MITKTQEEIMNTWNTKDINHPLVSIRCITYNQEQFISQTLNGFLEQITNFPFEVIVHDDASTDKTAKIIKEYERKYPLLIKPIYEIENQYSKHDGSLAKIVNKQIKGQYIAMCEGDDYWTDSNKLQMQVDFLEKNPNYVMCHTRARRFVQTKNKYLLRKSGKNNSSYYDIFINGSKIVTLTTCFRTKEYFDYLNLINPYNKKWAMGDLPIWLYFIKNYKVKFFSKVTGVYRILQESASHSNNKEKMRKFNQSTYDVRKYFSDIYNDNDLLEEYINIHNMTSGFIEKDYEKTLIAAKKLHFKSITKRRIIYILISIYRKIRNR